MTISRRGLALLLLVASVASAQHEAERTGSPSGRRIAAEMQAQVMLDAMLQELDYRIDSGALAEQILGSLTVHQQREKSYRLLRERVVEDFDSNLVRQVEEIRRAVNDGLESEAIELDWLMKESRTLRRGQLEEKQRLVATGFNDAFIRARERAGDIQWGEVLAVLEEVPVGEAEIEAASSGGNPIPTLMQQLLHRRASVASAEDERPLLEEVAKRAEQELRQRLDQGAGALKSQRALLLGRRARGAIGSTIAGELRRLLSETARGSDFGVFESVLQAVDRRASELAGSRLKSLLQSRELCEKAPRDFLRSEIARSPASHRESSVSASLLRSPFQEEAVDSWLLKHLSDQGDHRDGLRELRRMLSEDLGLGAIADESAERCLDVLLPTVRKAVAEDQVSSQVAQFSDLVASEEQVLAFRAEPLDAREATVVRIMGVHLAEDAPLLDEARRLIEDRLLSILKRGVQAMDDQLALVDRDRPNIQKEREAGLPRERLISSSMGRVSRGWSSQHHPDLFAKTGQTVAEIVDAAFKERSPKAMSKRVREPSLTAVAQAPEEEQNSTRDKSSRRIAVALPETLPSRIARRESATPPQGNPSEDDRFERLASGLRWLQREGNRELLGVVDGLIAEIERLIRSGSSGSASGVSNLVAEVAAGGSARLAGQGGGGSAGSKAADGNGEGTGGSGGQGDSNGPGESEAGGNGGLSSGERQMNAPGLVDVGSGGGGGLAPGGGGGPAGSNAADGNGEGTGGSGGQGDGNGPGESGAGGNGGPGSGELQKNAPGLLNGGSGGGGGLAPGGGGGSAGSNAAGSGSPEGGGDEACGQLAAQVRTLQALIDDLSRDRRDGP